MRPTLIILTYFILTGVTTYYMRVELLLNIVTFKTCSVISGLLDLLGKAGIDSYNFLFTWICHSSITDQHFTGIDYVYDGCLIRIDYIYYGCLIRIDYILDDVRVA